MKFKMHIFICTNQKAEGKKCCGRTTGENLVAGLKEIITDAGLKEKIRVNKAGCLDACAYGPAAVVYPEGVWYGNLNEEAMARIAKEHLAGGKPVEDYVIDFNQSARRWIQKFDQE